LNQARRQLTPTLPDSNSFDIPNGYQTTASGESFLICDKLVSRKKRMLIFASPKQLQVLFDSAIIFMDGTFLSTPPFFDQIFTIHGLKFDCSTIYTLFHKQSILFPLLQVFHVYLVYYLIEKKNTYQQLLQELNTVAASIGRTWKPEQIMTDFESGLIPAISAEVKIIDHFYEIYLFVVLVS
jgi:hypothetical protein